MQGSRHGRGVRGHLGAWSQQLRHRAVHGPGGFHPHPGPHPARMCRAQLDREAFQAVKHRRSGSSPSPRNLIASRIRHGCPGFSARPSRSCGTAGPDRCSLTLPLDVQKEEIEYDPEATRLSPFCACPRTQSRFKKPWTCFWLLKNPSCSWAAASLWRMPARNS